MTVSKTGIVLSCSQIIAPPCINNSWQVYTEMLQFLIAIVKSPPTHTPTTIIEFLMLQDLD